MTPKRTRPCRLLTACTCGVLVMFCTAAFASEPPDRVANDAKAAMQLVETTLSAATLKRVAGPQLLKRTTNAVFSALGKGLVLMQVQGPRRGGSKLYVKFDRDALPQLRWRTRF